MSAHPEALKDEYLDKKLAKLVCRMMYYCGLGDCWYEPMQKSKKEKLVYILWRVVSNCYMLSVVLSELTAFSTDLTVKETNDNVQMAIAHPTVLLKFVVVYNQRNKIKRVLKKLLEDTRISLTKQIEGIVVKRAKFNIFLLAMSMGMCLFFATIDGVRLHFKEGIPARTLVTSWPTRTDTGFFVEVTRLLIQISWWYIVGAMVICDGICIVALLVLCYKFKTLQMYFKGLRDHLVNNAEEKSQEELEEDYEKGFVFGIKLHSETMWCASETQSALGIIYSIQVAQSIGLMSMCLIKLVRLERSFTFLLANGAMMGCMLILTGIYMMNCGDITHEVSFYMMNCGDITHEASLVSTAMYQSGWELCARRKSLRSLIVLAIQRSQVPVIMTAFGIYDLSYANFISILRSSYSFFAVMY